MISRATPDRSPGSRPAKAGNERPQRGRLPQWQALHQEIGNQGMQRLLRARAAGGPLRVSRPDDPLEQQAHRVAGQAPAKSAHRHAGYAPASVGRVLAGSGSPMDPALRQDMEQRFDHDFSGVRIHTDAQAAESARAVNARAYTVGQDVVFAPGRYPPRSEAGRSLLAHELVHVMQQVPWLLMRQEDGETEPAEEEEGPGFWGTIGGGLMGEFNEDPDFVMIGLDVGVSLVPILDQVSDARDIIAHLYYLIAHSQYDRFMRWLGLVFTLIGLIPEVGSAIKGASKFIIRGVEVVISHLGDLLRPLSRLLPDVADLARLRTFVARNWDRFVTQATAAWRRTADRVTSLVRMIPDFVGGRLRMLREGWARVQRLAPAKLDEAFEWIRREWEEVLQAVQERLGGPRLAGATAGGPPGAMHMSGLGDEWRGPRSTGEAIDELEETVGRGSRSGDPDELGHLAAAGREIQASSVADWARRLGGGWRVLTRGDWPAWIRRRFPRGGPDMVAISDAERRIIVGDVAPSAASRVDVRPGMGLGAPASTRRASESALVRAGDEGTMPHLEKTLDDARRVAEGLPADMRNFQVFAQEWYWAADQQLSRLIQVYP